MIIDISKYNVVTDWDKVKASVDGVIIRCGYRGYGSGRIVADAKATEFAEACVKRGIPIGFYFMSQAITEQEAKEEADYTIAIAKRYKATLPLFIDSEDGDGTARVVRADGLTKLARTNVCKVFCNTINMAGFVGGIYASESWFNSKLDYESLKKYFIWCANYGKNTGAKTSTVKLSKVDMHQFTSKARVDGISGFVDVSDGYNFSIKKDVQDQSPAPMQDKDELNLPILKKGSKGKAVKVWQTIVGANPDGDFGTKTETATKEFQRKTLGVGEADGVVGKKTWKAGLNTL